MGLPDIFRMNVNIQCVTLQTFQDEGVQSYSLSLLPPVDVKHGSVEDIHQSQRLLWVQTALEQGHGGRVLLQTPGHQTHVLLTKSQGVC